MLTWTGSRILLAYIRQRLMYGGMYNVFNGTEVENIAVDFINEATGQIINSANSCDMGE